VVELAGGDRAGVGDAGDPPVVWLGRFDPDKGPDLAIDACRAAGLRLVLVGRRNPGPEERFYATAIAPRLGRPIEAMVNVGRATALRRLAAARCLLLPLRWREPFGMVMIEAMALGVPVVALRRGAVPEIVADGVTGVICDTADGLPDALVRVAGIDPDACRRHVRERFCAQLMACRYEQVYLTAMAAGRPSAGPRAGAGRTGRGELGAQPSHSGNLVETLTEQPDERTRVEGRSRPAMAPHTKLTDAGPAGAGVHDGLRLHTLVTALPAAPAGSQPQPLHRIVQLCRQPLSVVEIAVALGLPVDRTQALITELVAAGQVRCDQPDEEQLPVEAIERIARRVRGL
jgi:hypothetical protein